MRITHAHDPSSSEKDVCCSCIILLHLAFSISCFSVVLAHPLRRPLSVHNLAVLSSPKSAGYASLRSALNTGYEQITSVDHDTMLIDDRDLDEISDFSANTRENIGLFGVSTMIETCTSHVSHGDVVLQIKSKESMHQEIDC